MSRTLVTICTEVPTDITPEDLEKKHIDVKILDPIFKELELFSLVKRVLNTDIEEDTSEKLSDIKVSYTDHSQDPASLLQKLEEADLYALYVVFKNGTLYNSWPTHLCFSTKLHEVSYINLPNDKNKALEIILQFQAIFENKNKILQKISELESSKPVQQTNIDKKKFAQKYLGVIDTLKDDTVSEADKNHILRQFVEKIVLHRPSNEIEIFYHY